ncbi:hypothetical protein BZG36_04815, partial [Bifiguratus adelaidae]
MEPFVYYYCGCPDLNTGHSEDDRPDSFDSYRARTSLFSLYRLYFCEDCHRIRCPSCVQDEIISYYCPNCLFEVPSASVKSEKNRCARNCFECPDCFNTLSVVHDGEAAPNTASDDNGEAYYLSCGFCRWNSRQIGITFAKPTSLALQLQKSEDNLADNIEFDHLKEHFDKAADALLATSSTSAFLSLHGLNSMYSKFGLSLPPTQNIKEEDFNNYEPAMHKQDDDLQVLDQLMMLEHAHEASTTLQRSRQLHDQPALISNIRPQRIPLRVKKTKRCRSCRHVLIKPESKAQTSRFKIKLVAMNYIPAIAIVALPRKPWPFKVGIPMQFALKFTNPIYEEMHISLATTQLGDVDATITILSPSFTIGPYNELWDYDDELPSSQGSSKANPKGGDTPQRWEAGVYEKRDNYTCILVEVTPQKMGELKFPLLINYSYKAEDRMDTESNDGDIDIPSKSEDGSPEHDDGMRTSSFWVGDQTRHGLSPELHYTTIPPPEETAKAEKPFHPLARAGLLPQERILLMTIVGSLWGFVAGSYIGGRQSGLQYLAENAHRLPRTVQGWYFYHKTKNYKVMYGGIKRGARYAGQTGAVVMAYATLEAV